MSAMFSSGWSGMALIEDMNKGVTDRFLVSPVRREALIAGRLVKEAVVVLIQSVIIVLLALVVGATFPGGLGGVLVLLFVSAALGAAFGALSNGFALIMRQEEALIGAVQFLLLPLTFLSSAFLASNLIPRGCSTSADFNPLNWAVVAGRAATSSSPDWGVVASRAGFLAALMVVSMMFATRTFRLTSGRCRGGLLVARPAGGAAGWGRGRWGRGRPVGARPRPVRDRLCDNFNLARVIAHAVAQGRSLVARTARDGASGLPGALDRRARAADHRREAAAASSSPRRRRSSSATFR